MTHNVPVTGISARTDIPASPAVAAQPALPAPLADSALPADPAPPGGTVRRVPAAAGVALVGAAAFAIEMAVSGRYGYHRDELYFLAVGHHLAFGYVDQPPITPLLARISAAAFGNTLVGLRAVPAAAFAALIVLSALMSRTLGAGRTGQVLAALATATCGEYLGTMHLLTTTAPDFVAWSVTLLLVLQLLKSGDPRWWLAIGASIGIGLEAKWNIGFLAAGLALGFLATGSRRLLNSPYLALACVLIAAIAAPDVIWQALHGWPALDVFDGLQGSAGANRVTYWPAQIIYTGLALTPLWLAGLNWLLRDREGRQFRPAGLAAGFAIAIYFVLGGKPYYPGAIFTFLFAAGAIPLERRLIARTAARTPPAAHAAPAARAGGPGPKAIRARLRPAVLTGSMLLVSGAFAVPIALPVLPARTLHSVPLQKVNYDLAETIAWPKLVALVGREYRALPAPQRRLTTIITGNYGEAGAISRYGAGFGLPEALSGDNNFWLWGPPPAADTSAIAIGVDPALLRREFARVRQVATFSNGLGVSDDEQGAPVFIATGLRSSWAAAWPAFRDYS